MRSSAGYRLLLSHPGRSLRVPTKEERQLAAEPDGPPSRSGLGSCSTYHHLKHSQMTQKSALTTFNFILALVWHVCTDCQVI